MDQRSIVIHGITLHYKVCNDTQEKTIVFIHGNSSSSQLWIAQLNSIKLNGFRLLAFDLPGHGLSSASSDAEEGYSVVGFARIMAQAIEQVVSSPFVLVGFSLGSNVVAEMLGLGASPKGVFLLGPSIINVSYDLSFVFKPGTSHFFQDEVNHDFLNMYFKDELKNSGEGVVQTMVEDFIKVKPGLRSSIAQSVGKQKFTDEISHIVKSNIPCGIAFGASDSIVNNNYLDASTLKIWRNTIYKLQDAGHFVQVDQPEVINQLLEEYCRDVFQ